MVNNGSVISDLELDKLYELLIIYENQVNDSAFYSLIRTLWDKLKTENIHADEIFLCLSNATKNNPLVLKKDTWKVLNEKYASVYNENAKICCLELLNNFLKSINRLNAKFDHIFNLINASFENESIDFIKNKLICIHNLIVCDTKYIEQGFIADFLFENLLKTNIGVNFQIGKKYEFKTFEILHTFLIDCHQSSNIYNDVIGLLENISKNGTSFQKAENIVSFIASSLTSHNKNSGVILNIIKNIAFNKEKIPSNALEHVLKLISDTNSKLSIINTSMEILTEIVKYDFLTPSDNILLNLSQILIDSDKESVCENILKINQDKPTIIRGTNKRNEKRLHI
ncbi:hypothetical protein BpHYR1_037342 [Brachionus plicatilis]|uniref:Uncharacterized protein n=1 Tax=Brachionus plicatilis TaxID=10195 RepID=A0A3M7PLJ1_BRAPC|nr:hypothetical protein BpHYR1_037342 [Brachionus plicatilis]